MQLLKSGEVQLDNGVRLAPCDPRHAEAVRQMQSCSAPQSQVLGPPPAIMPPRPRNPFHPVRPDHFPKFAPPPREFDCSLGTYLTERGPQEFPPRVDFSEPVADLEIANEQPSPLALDTDELRAIIRQVVQEEMLKQPAASTDHSMAQAVMELARQVAAVAQQPPRKMTRSVQRDVRTGEIIKIVDEVS